MAFVLVGRDVTVVISLLLCKVILVGNDLDFALTCYFDSLFE